MSIPINGRIAILDDNTEEVLPLMQELSKRQCPYSYYTGELKHLPDESENTNDIRVLFLDIYLTTPEPRSEKEIKSILVSTLTRIIPKDNFPYLIIFWSKHEEDHKELIKEIFDKDLTDRKPVDYLSIEKSKYFPNNGERAPDFEANLQTLWSDIINALEKVPVYDLLLKWENFVHNSSANTIEEVFSTVQNIDEWMNNSNKLFRSLGVSFSGKHYKKMDDANKNKSSFFTFNNIFMDTLDHKVETAKALNIKIPESSSNIDSLSVANINSKLLYQKGNSINSYPGSLLVSKERDDKYIADVFMNVINHGVLKKQIENENQESSKSKIDKLCSNLRKEIRASWKKVWLIVTPLCDFVQKKEIYSKIVKGLLIESKYKIYLDDKSEAVFISPTFMFEEKEYLLVLQLRNFISVNDSSTLDKKDILFRLRQNLLVEIQSKLSRQINRHGILFLDHDDIE